MALVLTEEQSMLRDSARGLISDKAPVSHLRSLRDSKDATGFSRELWKAFAEMGFSGLLVPENFGGSGLGCVEAGVVMEEIGRTLMPSPFLSTAVLAVSALSRGGSEAQKSAHLPKIADGSLLAALAVDEGAKHRPLQTQPAGGALRQRFQAERRQGSRGRRPHRRSPDRRRPHRRRRRRAQRADAVPGRSQGQGRRRSSAPRWSMRTTPRRIEFANVEVDADHVLGEVDQGAALLDGVLNIGRGAVASEMVGLSEEVFGRTVDLSQGAQAVRQADRRIPGAAAPRRPALHRYRDHPRRRPEGAADAGRRFRTRPGLRSRSPRPAPAPRRRWRCRKACRCTAAWA